MRIVKNYNSDEDSWIIKDIQEVYKALTSEDITHGDRYDAKMIERIISWLPSIVEIEMFVSCDNEWINITFSNQQQLIGLYNTGVEDGLLILFEPPKPEEI